ncbi:hypothetical protein ACEYYA_05440 [Paracoccus sp. p3-h83]|uniref:hypothetical protein n=1 Tax=Paracoccus sp. p3-h83 TaxID=3342805 RepID=UPI0035B862C8
MKDITLTLTIGRRPDALAYTLEGLWPLTALLPVLAINDFGDEETNDVFRRACPDGRLICDGIRRGHHGAMDRLLADVDTRFILHCEDDWHFWQTDFLPDARALLAANPLISQVCLRDLGDFSARDVNPRDIRTETRDGVQYARVDHQHSQWFGFTFNPSLFHADLVRQAGGFSAFRKERHLSRHLRRQGRFVAFLMPSACEHLGGFDSMSQPATPPWPKRLRNWLRALIGRG